MANKSKKKRAAAMPYWICECGEQDLCRPEDERVSIGKAVFRKPGCHRCHRPMQLAGTTWTPEKAQA